MRFECDPVELDFMDRATWRFENTVQLDAEPAAVFDMLADGEAWPKWFSEIESVEWTTPDPKGIGTTRTVSLGSVTLDEYFLAWTPGERFTFRFDAASAPLFRAGVEEYLLKPAGPGKTAFSYTVYIDPSWLLRLVGWIAKPQFQQMFSRASRDLAAYIRQTG